MKEISCDELIGILESLGFDAVNLSDGMRGWSRVGNFVVSFRAGG
ncbi:MAG: hypothetical protein ACE5HS_12715 [bacterium]